MTQNIQKSQINPKLQMLGDKCDYSDLCYDDINSKYKHIKHKGPSKKRNYS